MCWSSRGSGRRRRTQVSPSTRVALAQRTRHKRRGRGRCGRSTRSGCRNRRWSHVRRLLPQRTRSVNRRPVMRTASTNRRSRSLSVWTRPVEGVGTFQATRWWSLRLLLRRRWQSWSSQRVRRLTAAVPRMTCRRGHGRWWRWSPTQRRDTVRLHGRVSTWCTTRRCSPTQIGQRGMCGRHWWSQQKW